jgi:hypothetical protein
MTITVALAGDTMLGRGVAATLARTPPKALVAPEVLAALEQADLVVVNLECCISERGQRWDAPGKPFFFRAPPSAVELLVLVTLDAHGPARLEALPLKLEFCHTRLAEGPDAAWMRRRFTTACATLGTTLEDATDRLVINWR